MRPLPSQDELTRLPTRAAFDADLHRRLAEGEECALLLCDLDYLKLLNDTFGHLAGDEALRALAQALQTGKQPDWGVYRLGGDEFAVLAGGPVGALAAWGQEVLGQLRERPGRPLRVSMGVAAWQPGMDGPPALFARADARLYVAKRRGRGQVVLDDVSPALDLGSDSSRLLERDGARADVTAFLHGGLDLHGARLNVHAPPGGGLSAFLREANLIAQYLGYQTLQVRGDPARAARQHGAWEGASLSGMPLTGPLGPALREGRTGAPLALLLDAPEHLGPFALTELSAPLTEAQVILTGRASTPSGKAAEAHLLTLAPLSDRAVLALAEAQVGPLGEAGAAWLLRQVQGLPARLGPQLSALRLEAELRCQSVLSLTRDDAQFWEGAVARHVPPSRPPPWPHLYGRAAQVREGARLLGDHALLSLTGPTGRGKTRLARQLLAELGGQCSGGVHEISLRGVRLPEVALARISEVLLGSAVAPVSVDTVTRLLRRRPTLLLLDDAAPYTLPARMLETLLARSPDTRIILTAQAPLGVRGEASLALPPLSSADLRAALAAQADPGDRTEQEDGGGSGALEVLTRAAAGEPDALSTLLPLVQTFGLSGAAEHLERTAPLCTVPLGTAKLKGGGRPKYAGPEHAGLEHAGLEHAGRLRQTGAGPWWELGSPERRVLAALSIFGGPFDLPWAQAVSGASPFLLSALIHRQMLLPEGGGLYQLPDQLLERSRAELRRSPGVRRRAHARGLHRAEATLRAYPPESAAWFGHLDAHYMTLRALFAGRFHAPDPPEPALVRALLHLMPYRLSRAYLYDAREDLQAALKAVPGGPEPSDAALRTGLQLALAATLQRLGEHTQAGALASEARAHAETLGNPSLLAEALLTEGRILQRRSAYSEANARFRRVYTELRDAVRPHLLLRALGGLALSAVYLGKLKEAQSHVDEGLRSAAPQSRPALYADLLSAAGLIAIEHRDLEAAQTLMEKALALHEAYGGRSSQTLNLTSLAWIALLRGDYALSVQHSGRVLQQAQDSGQGWEVANAVVNLGHALARLGQWDEAQARHQEAARLAAECDAPSVIAEALGGLADVLARQGRPGEARALLDLALTHPGANAEFHSFFAPLRRALAEPAAALSSETLAPETLSLLRDLEAQAPGGWPEMHAYLGD